MLVTRSSVASLQAKKGLPAGNQAVGWIVFGTCARILPPGRWARCRVNAQSDSVSLTTGVVVSFLMPLIHRLDSSNHYMQRLMVLFLTCAPTFVILTISYEGLFYVAFSITLLAWVRLEYSIHTFTAARASQNGHVAKEGEPATSGPRPLNLSDVRVVLFFMVLLQSAFFSTGNIASVSSFSLESVSRLLPVFDPFSQGALLIIKLMIPFALISANLGVLNKRLGVAPSALFMLTMGLSDILTLYFFWVVKDEGSWLEIGSTISHFVIGSLLCVFVAALEGLSGFFISGLVVGDKADATARPGEENGKKARSSEPNGETSGKKPGGKNKSK